MAEMTHDWRKLHPLSPILRAGFTLLIVIGLLLANMRDLILNNLYKVLGVDDYAVEGGDPVDDALQFASHAQLGWLIITGGVLAVLLLIAFFSWLSWRFTKFRITENTIELRTGVIFRGRKETTLNRIQAVDLERPFLARVFGLTALRIGTAAGDMQLQYLAHAEAVELRRDLLLLLVEKDIVSDSDVAAAVQEAEDAGVAETQSSLLADRAKDVIDQDLDGEALKQDTGRLILGYLLKLPLIIIVLTLTGGSIVLGFFIKDKGDSLLLLIPVVVPMLFVFGAQLIGALNKQWNTAVQVQERELRMRSGLTTTKSESVKLDRVHTVAVSQPLLWRIPGWYKVRIYTSGFQTVGAGRSYEVMPTASASQVQQLVSWILPGRVTETELARVAQFAKLEPLNYKAERKAFPLLLWSPKREGAELIFSEKDKTPLLALRGGIAPRQTSLIKLELAQGITVASSFGHRLFGLAAVTVHCTGAVNKNTVRALDIAAAKEAFTRVNSEIVGAIKRESMSAE
ncbi:PH domain-containing protein [Canibacter zhoujuaniae]|uniref:PH domain-containing protein n=1 Tax=Canibacter zhoujuaniae TaxID=2708343 RepID=UPI00141DA806|nr:PH domain-containing protein [Canibacter zhoujuaniae]